MSHLPQVPRSKRCLVQIPAPSQALPQIPAPTKAASPQAQPSPTPRLEPPINEPSYYTLSLIAPSGTFSHDQAAELLEAIWSLEVPALASITATVLKLELSITCPPGTELTFQKALYGVLPDLSIEVKPAVITRRTIPTLLSISGERPEDVEALPMKVVAEQGKRDPINRILEACYPLEDDETVEIHFFLKPAFSERLDRAYRSSFEEVSFLWIFKWQELRFNPKVYDEVIERMRQFSFDVVSVIAISGQNKDKLYQTAHALTAAFSSRTTNTGSKVRNFARGISHDDWQYQSSYSLNDVSLDDRFGTLMTVSELANIFTLPSDQVKLPALARLKLPPVALSPSMLNADGLTIGYYTFRGVRSAINLPEPDFQRGPTAILGMTGQGKSNEAHQIARAFSRRNPDAAIVSLDPHGQANEEFCLQSIPDDQLEKTYLVDFSDVDHPIGLPIMSKPAGLSQDAYVSTTFELIKILFADNWNPGRMERVVKNTVSLLCTLPDPTLLDFSRVFNDQFFRQKALPRTTDPAVHDFFDYYDGCSPQLQRQISEPVVNRIGSLYETAPLRNITCRPSGLQLAEALDEGARLLCSFSGPEIESDANLLMEIVVAKIHQAMLARAHTPEHVRRPALMILDESQRIRGSSLPQILSQDRKFGMIPVLLTQYLANWSPSLERSVLGNNASLIAFRLGADDAKKLAPTLHPYSPEQIMSLNAHQPLVKISVNGISSPTFPMETERVNAPANPQHLAQARENARRRWGLPRAEVDKLFQRSPTRQHKASAAWDDFDVSPLT